MILRVLVIFVVLPRHMIQLLAHKLTFNRGINKVKTLESTRNGTAIQRVAETWDLFEKYMGFFGEVENALNECFEEPKIWCNRGTKYRTIDGSCNNLNIRSWGMANTALLRIVPANYEDNIKYPRKARNGNNLPDPALISRYLSQAVRYSNRKETLLMTYFARLLSRDVAIELDKKGERINCCDDHELLYNGICMTFGNHGIVLNNSTACYNFIRSQTTNDLNCLLEPVHQLSNATSYLDASFLYGVNKQMSQNLRVYRSGRLRTQETYHFPSLLKSPPADYNKHIDNKAPFETAYIFDDIEMNQNAALSACTILFFRLHNFICDVLAWLNPHWKDEKLFQEARRIVIAIYQHVVYYEFLPIIIGVEYAKEYDLLPLEKGHLKNYNPGINPTTINSFSTAAFRIHHSYLNPITSVNMNGKLMTTVSKLTNSSKQDNNIYDALLQELMTNPLTESKQDDSIVSAANVRTADILRGRDHGIPTYNQFRQICGYGKASNFQQYKDHIKDTYVDMLSELYEHVDDVDLYVASILEQPTEDTLTGPVSQCITAEAFFRWKYGDRFFYEFADQPASFTTNQLREIRKSTMSFVICVGSDNIRSVQVNSFYVPSKLNPLISCQSVSRPDFSYWKEAR